MPAAQNRRRIALLFSLVLVFGLSIHPAALFARSEAAKAPESRGVRFRLSDEGYIMTWLVCGPFPDHRKAGVGKLPGRGGERAGFDFDWLRPIGGERRASPHVGLVVGRKGVAPRIWRPIAAEPLGYVNLFERLRPNINAVAYAACILDCPVAARALLEIGSNDGVKVWLNGKQVHLSRRPRPWTPDEDKVAVRLRPGRNRLLLKVDQLSGGWGFSVKLLNILEEPLREVGVELEGEVPPAVIVRMLARAIEVEPERPALTAGEALVANLRLGPTAPTTTATVVAEGRVEDEAGSPVATLGTVHLSGAADRPAAFRPWRPPANLPDGVYTIRARIATESGVVLAVKKARFAYAHWYGRRLAEAKRAVERAASGLKDRRGVLATITLPSLRRMICDAEQRWANLEQPGPDLAFIWKNLRDAEDGAWEMERGRDWFATHTGHLVKAYRCEHDGTLQPYSVYVPADYDPSTSWPLVIGLHGATSNHWLHLRRLFGEGNRPGETDEAAKKTMPPLPDVPFLVACPNGRETFGYEGMGEEDVWRVLADMMRAYNVDATRIYLTGLSMGGAGTWHLGLLHPDRFAAIAPVCGATDYRFMPRPTGRTKPYERVILEAQSALNHAENALNLPIHIFQGTADPVIPPRNSSAMFRRFVELGYPVALTQYSAVGHNSWDEAYRGATIFKWFSHYRLNPCPRRVVYRAVVSKPVRAYWVEIDAPLQLRRFSRIEAWVDKTNRVDVRVENVRRFSLFLDHRIVETDRAVAVAINGRRMPRVWVEEPKPITYEWDGGAFRRTFKPYDPPLLPGLGMRPLLDWHIYVYGVSGSPREADVNRHAALRMADWGEWVDVKWPVLSDEEITDAEIAANNIALVGTPANNRILARIADALPIKIEQGTIRMGRRKWRGPLAAVAMIYRNPLAPKRYVFVYGAFSDEGFTNMRLHLPVPPPDYVIFDGRGRVAKAGFFDSSWRPE